MREVDLLAGFLPSGLLQHLSELSSVRELRPQMRVSTGVVLMADMSGYTALGNRLARGERSLSREVVRGLTGKDTQLASSLAATLLRSAGHSARVGAEELQTVLRAFFGECLTLIERFGGDLIRIAGDAVIALFTGDDAAARAADCAQACRTRLQGSEALGGERVDLHVGVSAGEVRELVAGGVDDRFQYVVAGPAIDGMGPALSAARSGEVVLTDAVAAQLPRGAVERRDEYFLLRTAPEPAAPQADAFARSRRGLVAHVAGRAALLRAFVNEAVVENLEAEAVGLFAGVHDLTVLFVKVTGLPSSLDAVAEPLNDALCLIQTQAALHGATLKEMTMDDKGLVAVATLGGPPLGTRGAPAKGCRMGHGLAAAGFQVGVATGEVFCGSIVGASRREFAMVGSTMNLAARIMGRARGGVLCDRPTALAARRDRGLLIEAAETVELKGYGFMPLFRPVVVGPEAAEDPLEAGGDQPSLSLADVVARTREAWGVAEVHPLLADFLWVRSEGRPRFLELLLDGLGEEAEGLSAHGPTSVEQRLRIGTYVPPAIQSAVSAGVTRLSHFDATVLQVCSLVNRQLSPAGVAAVMLASESVRKIGLAQLDLPDEREHDDALLSAVGASLRRLAAAELLAGAGDAFSMESVVTADAVAFSVPLAVRKEVHAAAAERLRGDPAAFPQRVRQLSEAHLEQPAALCLTMLQALGEPFLHSYVVGQVDLVLPGPADLPFQRASDLLPCVPWLRGLWNAMWARTAGQGTVMAAGVFHRMASRIQRKFRARRSAPGAAPAVELNEADWDHAVVNEGPVRSPPGLRAARRGSSTQHALAWSSSSSSSSDSGDEKPRMARRSSLSAFADIPGVPGAPGGPEGPERIIHVHHHHFHKGGEDDDHEHAVEELRDPESPPRRAVVQRHRRTKTKAQAKKKTKKTKKNLSAIEAQIHGLGWAASRGEPPRVGAIDWRAAKQQATMSARRKLARIVAERRRERNSSAVRVARVAESVKYRQVERRYANLIGANSPVRGADDASAGEEDEEELDDDARRIRRWEAITAAGGRVDDVGGDGDDGEDDLPPPPPSTVSYSSDEDDEGDVVVPERAAVTTNVAALYSSLTSTLAENDRLLAGILARCSSAK